MKTSLAFLHTVFSLDPVDLLERMKICFQPMMARLSDDEHQRNFFPPCFQFGGDR